MTSRRSSRTYHTPALSRARLLSAREELTAQPEPPAQEEPMRRWPHPIPMAGSPVPARTVESEASPAMTQVLEQLQTQNQLLVDLLGAVNSLTAAVLVKAAPPAQT